VAHFVTDIFAPAWLAAEPIIGVTSNLDARVLLLTTAMQESGLSARKQQGGPARSFWQFEQAAVSPA